MLGVIPPLAKTYDTNNETDIKLSILDYNTVDEEMPSRVRTAPMCARRPQPYSTAQMYKSYRDRVSDQSSMNVFTA